MIRRIVLTVAVSCWLISLTIAEETSNGDRVAALAAPLGTNDAIAVARLETQKVDLGAAVDWVAKTLRLTDDETKPIRRDMMVAEETLKAFHAAGGQEVVLLVYPGTVSSPGQPLEVAGIAVAAEGKSKQLGEFLSDVVDQFQLQTKVEGNRVVFGPAHRLEQYRDDAKPSTMIAKAIDSTDDATLQLAVLLPDDLRRVLSETLPPLPEPFLGASGKDLAQWFTWGSIALSLPPEARLNITVQTPSEAAAQSLAKATSRWYEATAPVETIREHLPDFDRLQPLITPRAQRNQVVLKISSPEDLEHIRSALAVPLKAARDEAVRAKQTNSMKQIGLAMHNYHDANGRFPPAAFRDKKEKPLLSWRVHLLPYVGENALFKEFRLEEPWDSDHNKKLLARMPSVYANDRVAVGKEGYTTFVVPIGSKTVFEDSQGMKLHQITDGSSNTVLVVEADAKHAVPWTKPADLEFDAEDPLVGIFVDSTEHIMLLFGDGSVQSLSKAEAEKQLPALFTASGGEVVPR